MTYKSVSDVEEQLLYWRWSLWHIWKAWGLLRRHLVKWKSTWECSSLKPCRRTSHRWSSQTCTVTAVTIISYKLILHKYLTTNLQESQLLPCLYKTERKNICTKFTCSLRWLNIVSWHARPGPKTAHGIFQKFSKQRWLPVFHGDLFFHCFGFLQNSLKIGSLIESQQWQQDTIIRVK